MESLQFGGLIGGGGPARVPQLRWTQPLGGWGLLGALSVSAEAPETEIFATGASGIFAAGPTTAVNLAAPTFAGSGAAGAAACQVTLAQFAAGTCNVTVANPLKNSAPELVAAWYIPQPWGHVDFATVVRPDLRVEQPFGAGVDRTYIGFGGAFSGDVKPGWFGWSKDFITWNVVGAAITGTPLIDIVAYAKLVALNPSS